MIFPVIGLGLAALVVVLALGWVRRRARGGAERRLSAAAGAAPAERLIRFEQERSPGLSREEAARRAYDRLGADRTR
jgi:hypothetical protein